MSLCGRCEGEGSGVVELNMCSIDGDSYYCVGCLFVASRWVRPIRVPLSALDEQFDTISWDLQSAVKICEQKLEPHWSRIQQADLGYPILVTREASNGRGPAETDPRERFIVLDGRHRIVKSRLLGFTEIWVQVMSPKHLDRCFLGLAADLFESRSEEGSPSRDALPPAPNARRRVSI